jgi:predicted cupin superfamily sugar epimerase
MSKQKIAEIKQRFNMLPHPEGGYYAEQYRSVNIVRSAANGAQRSALTHIYFLLTPGDISRWHKVLHDEIWHVYEGAPLRILSFNSDISANQCSNSINDEIIGNKPNALETDYFKVIQGGHFQAAQSTGEYTLVGCCVAPGFVFEDFSYVEDAATKKWIGEQGLDYKNFL